MVDRQYIGKKYDKEIRTLKDLNKAMDWLVKNGPYPSALEHNAPCSVGETVEAVLNLPPSTRRVDLDLEDANVELKSGRISASTPKSEATSTIQFVQGDPYTGTSDSDRMRQFVQERGYTTVSAARIGVRTQKDYKGRINLYHAVNNVPHRLTGLYIEYDEELNRIWFCHKDDGRLGFYDETNIEEIQSKYKLQYYIQAEVLEINGETYYNPKQVDALVTKLYPFTVKRMYDAVVSGEQALEFRAHICDDDYCVEAGAKQCLPPGKLRCRGTAFRTPKRKIPDVWQVQKIAPSNKFNQRTLFGMLFIGTLVVLTALPLF